MLDALTPPTDNLYKFIAIGELAFALVAFIALLREQSAGRAAFISADIDLRANGYVEGPGEPKDVELRKAWLRREWAKSENVGLMNLTTGMPATRSALADVLNVRLRRVVVAGAAV